MVVIVLVFYMVGIFVGFVFIVVNKRGKVLFLWSLLFSWGDR